jgi:hypothetical protein
MLLPGKIARETMFGQRFEHAFLIAKVAINHRRLHSGCFCDSPRRQRIASACVEQMQGSGKDALPRTLDGFLSAFN